MPDFFDSLHCGDVMQNHRAVTNGGDALDRVFRRVEIITSVGSVIGGLEQIATASNLADDDIFSWPVLRLMRPRLTHGPARHIAKIMQYPQVVGLIQTKTLAAAGLMLPGSSRTQRGVMAAAVCGTNLASQTRAPFGLDGSDHFAFINYAGAVLEKLFPHDQRAREAAAAFIACHSCLSYFTAGVSKAISPVWRDGTAIPSIFRTTTYGDQRFYHFVRDRPRLSKTLAWTTIIGETAFPLALVAPKPIARGILGMGLAFHLANARYMGLNRFIWAFAGTYPAVDHLSSSIGPSVRRSLAPTVRAAVARPGRVAAGAGLTAAAVAGTGAGVTLLRNWRRKRLARSAPGDFVTVGGNRIHVMARTANTGGGTPSVIFESAMACPVTEWSWVMEKLRPDIPYLAYDRPGNGWSGPANSLDAEKSVARLRVLTQKIGLKPPYILVGHSSGGLLIRSFAMRNLDLVAGMVLVDSSHPDQINRSARQRESMPWTRQRLARQYFKSLLWPEKARNGLGEFASLPEAAARASVECLHSPEAWRTARREFTQVHTSWAHDARKLTDLAPLPVAVLTASGTVAGDPVHGELQHDLTKLSSVHRHEIVDDSDHSSLVMHPTNAERVAAHIDWALSSQPSLMGVTK
ncbi:alpha/beta fold hydrolase [Streptomyces sp. NPDC059255]|uniref:alpha/beta fold hydrolase n=1 Tax=Streptomyces sp. NPDC059255 TaxID=3346793 RepID=UPI00369266A8